MTSGPQGASAAARRFEPAAFVPLAVLTGVWSWWGIKQGAFFGTVYLPGTILLCATWILTIWVAPWRGRLSRSRPAIVGAAGLVALGAWAALSAVWSPAPDFAIADGQRILAYSLAFGLGLWLCNLLGPRIHLAMAPLAIAGAVVGAVAVGGLLTANGLHPYLYKGTLEYPLSYRNANGAFFLIAVWPAVGLASRRGSPWWVRAPALAAATLCLDLALLSQSRASLIAGPIALCVYLGLSRDRARAFGWLTLAALPALLVIPPLVDLYRAANGDASTAVVVERLHDTGRAALIGSALAIGFGAAAALLGDRLPASPRRVAIANRAVGVGLVVLVLGGSITFAAAVGDPIAWISQRVQQFRSGHEISSAGRSTHFSLNAGTERGELWRVALLEAGRHPLLGDGAGGWRYAYLRDRSANSIAQAHDAHSVEFENLSELGIPGFLLLVCAVGGAGAGAVRSRHFGPEAAALSTVALAAGAYWLVHSSVDWFWPYPAVTAPVFALLGAACAPAVGVDERSRGGRGRALLAAGAAVLACSAIPPLLSQRYVDQAYAEWRTDPSRAYDDLGQARSLNPLSIDPLLAEGAIARALGDRARAIDAFKSAARKRPEEGASDYFLAVLYQKRNPRLARREIAAARQRDPRNEQILALQRKLNGGQ